MRIDQRAFGILLSYYSHPRKFVCGRKGEGWRRPSMSTCRNEINDILNASLFLLYQPLQDAFKSRKRVNKITHVAWNSDDNALSI